MLIVNFTMPVPHSVNSKPAFLVSFDIVKIFINFGLHGDHNTDKVILKVSYYLLQGMAIFCIRLHLVIGSFSK